MPPYRVGSLGRPGGAGGRAGPRRPRAGAAPRRPPPAPPAHRSRTRRAATRPAPRRVPERKPPPPPGGGPACGHLPGPEGLGEPRRPRVRRGRGLLPNDPRPPRRAPCPVGTPSVDGPIAPEQGHRPRRSPAQVRCPARTRGPGREPRAGGAACGQPGGRRRSRPVRASRPDGRRPVLLGRGRHPGRQSRVGGAGWGQTRWGSSSGADVPSVRRRTARNVAEPTARVTATPAEPASAMDSRSLSTSLTP